MQNITIELSVPDGITNEDVQSAVKDVFNALGSTVTQRIREAAIVEVKRQIDALTVAAADTKITITKV